MPHSLLMLTAAVSFLLLSGCEQAEQETEQRSETNSPGTPEPTPESIASDKELQAVHDSIIVGKTTLREVCQAMKMSYSDSLGEQTRWGHTDSHGNGLYLSLSDSVVTAKSRNREDIFSD